MEEVSASAEEMSAQIEQISVQVQDLATTADEMRRLAGRFQLEASEAEVPTSRILGRRGLGEIPSSLMHRLVQA